MCRFAACRWTFGLTQRISLQVQAREPRYRAMAKLAEDVGADRIVVGQFGG